MRASIQHGIRIKKTHSTKLVLFSNRRWQQETRILLDLFCVSFLNPQYSENYKKYHLNRKKEKKHSVKNWIMAVQIDTRKSSNQWPMRQIITTFVMKLHTLQQHPKLLQNTNTFCWDIFLLLIVKDFRLPNRNIAEGKK